MKFFNWVHRKCQQHATQDTIVESSQRDHGTLEESQLQDWYGVKNGHADRSSSSRRLNTSSLKAAEARSKNTKDHYFRDIKMIDDEVDDALRDMRHGLLAIGTLGTTTALSNGEKMKASESEGSTAYSRVGPNEVRELQEQLEKVFYIKDEDDNAEIHQSKALAIKNEAVNDELKEEEKCEDNWRERQMQPRKKVFPLREFLEVPIEPSAVKKKKKRKNHIPSSLSNLFGGGKNDGGLQERGCEKNEKLAKANANAKHILSYSSLIKALFKSNPVLEPGVSHPRTRLQKFFLALRKKNPSPSSKEQLYLEAMESMAMASSSADGGQGNNVQQQEEAELAEESESFRFKECVEEYDLHRWGLRDDLWVLKSDNEYWINTDDEYVVLEL